MKGLDFNNINSASALANAEIAMREIERENARKDAQQNAPIIDGLHGIVSEMQVQNKILAQQVEEAKRESEKAKKDARNAKIFSWISFSVTTLIAVASLIVAIVK